LIAVRPLDHEPRHLATSLMMLAFGLALYNLVLGITALGRPHMAINGVPGPMILFMGSIAFMAGVGDWRMIRGGGIRGTKRIARHLWRMCFGLFIASGSFFLGQMKFFPKPVRIPMLMAIPALAPLVMLIYWMWRVRARGRLPAWSLKNAAVPQNI
jgi:hypothetical protein